jgi:hypothetical protein
MFYIKRIVDKPLYSGFSLRRRVYQRFSKAENDEEGLHSLLGNANIGV